MRLQKDHSGGKIRSNRLETIFYFAVWQNGHNLKRSIGNATHPFVVRPHAWKDPEHKQFMSINDVVQKKEKLNHAKFVIKKTSELNFIKVFETL